MIFPNEWTSHPRPLLNPVTRTALHTSPLDRPLPPLVPLNPKYRFLHHSLLQDKQHMQSSVGAKLVLSRSTNPRPRLPRLTFDLWILRSIYVPISPKAGSEDLAC